MSRAMYSGVSGLKAHQTKMDVIGNNIANVNTYGYKAQHAVFSDVFYQTIRGASTGTPASTVGYGSQIAGIRSDMGSSNLQSTDNGMDCAITGEGFFQVKTGSGTYYTKAGEFSIDTSTGNLVDVKGNDVLDNNGSSIHISDDLTKVTGVSIGPDGKVDYTEDGTSKTAGPIGLANFPNPNGLQAAGSGYYAKSSNSGEPTLKAPGEGGVGSLQSGALEMSNVDLASEFADMITTERGFQANSRIITVSDTMLEELINLKR